MHIYYITYIRYIIYIHICMYTYMYLRGGDLGFVSMWGDLGLGLMGGVGGLPKKGDPKAIFVLK